MSREDWLKVRNSSEIELERHKTLFDWNLEDDSGKKKKCALSLCNNGPYLFKIIENCVSERVRFASKPIVAVQEIMSIIADPLIVEQLYLMGFPLEVAKKAVIKSKN